ncbi:MAG: glycosyltransferase family 4 protein [Symploca sp. SIO1A3]|nr:glycosyltransferase family 4 protein [Symploca sp. SIO1A3]
MPKINRVAVIGTISSSMVSFRGSLLADLKGQGCEVFAFAIDYDAETEAKVKQLGAQPVLYQLERTGTNPIRDLSSTLQLIRLLKQYKIDTVFSYFIKPVIYASLAAKIAGVPNRFALLPGLGYAFTKTLEQQTTLKQRVVEIVVRQLLKSSLQQNKRVFLYNPDDIKEVLQSKLVEPQKVCRLNGTGIQLKDYPFIAPWNSPITFLLAARLLVEKGIREFAQAAAKIKPLYPHTHFILLGNLDTNPGSLTEEQIQNWTKDGIIEWPGHVPDIRPWLKKTSVYVLPSYREGVPRSTQEALAMGRAVITTNAPGCRETVKDGVNGYLVPVRDVDALAVAMIQFIKQPTLIANMGRESRKLAEEKFDVCKINAKLLHEMGLT